MTTNGFKTVLIKNIPLYSKTVQIINTVEVHLGERMQESVIIASIGIRCIHMRTTYALKKISDKYGVKVELANIKNGDHNIFVGTDDSLGLMLLGLQKGDACKIRVLGETGLSSPATTDVLNILEAREVTAA
jgi:phosphotransferase system HPr-like phosphotransfer protein